MDSTPTRVATLTNREPSRMFRKTCHRYNVPGHAHALTFSCFRRQPFLARDRSRRWFVESLAAAGVKHGFAVWAYALMPEHVHLLIFPKRDPYSVSDILTDIKQPVTRAAVRYLKDQVPGFLSGMQSRRSDGRIAHRFWQRGGGYDRNLINPAVVFETIEYIHANPVRRGLAPSPEDWYWSSARYYGGRSDVPLLPDNEDLPLRDVQWR